MITKFLIVALCILSGTMTGVIFSKKLTRRAEYFSSLLSLLNTIISEMKFRKSATKKILSQFAETDRSPLKDHLNEYIRCEDLSSLKLSKSVLTAQESEDVKKLLLSLGTADSDTQIFELENQKLKISDLSALAEDKRKRFGPMFIKLGFFAGLALGIIIL